MRKSRTLRGFSGAIVLARIAQAYLPIPLYMLRIDHVHGLAQQASG